MNDSEQQGGRAQQPSRRNTAARSQGSVSYLYRTPRRHHRRLDGERGTLEGNNAAIKMRHKTDRTEYGHCHDISLVEHTGKVLLELVDYRLRECCEAKSMLPSERHGFRSQRSTLDSYLLCA